MLKSVFCHDCGIEMDLIQHFKEFHLNHVFQCEKCLSCIIIKGQKLYFYADPGVDFIHKIKL